MPPKTRKEQKSTDKKEEQKELAKKEVSKKKVKVEKKVVAKKTKKPASQKKKKEKKTVEVYTPEQKVKFKELVEELSKKTVDLLKPMLAANDQSGTGNKTELILKIVDGMILGKIPRCLRCCGGRPRFNATTGEYKCPGFMDDDVFKFCNKKYTFDELKREPWVSIQQPKSI